MMELVQLLLAVIYISFISLGLPDGLLGAGWPSMQPEFGVPVSWMGPVALIISTGTVISSLVSDRLTRKLGTGMLTAVSVATTAVSLFGFAFSGSYWMLCLWAIPYGLGAGSVDSCLNNYVAIHYEGKHMSWLHCMWSVGAMTGPAIMGAVLTLGQSWNYGYLYIGILQAVLTLALFGSLKIWKRPSADQEDAPQGAPLKLRQIVRFPGAKAIFLTFFCYCALEQTAGQWAGSYFFGHGKLSEDSSALLASLFYVGITVGRFFNGFLTMRFSDKALVRGGIGIILAGVVIMLLPLGVGAGVAGFLLIGLGCAPIYPCVIHSTPDHFGAENSQAVIGVEMACAYVGICVMPPVFGFVADWLGLWTMPVFLGIICLTMLIFHELLHKQVKHR